LPRSYVGCDHCSAGAWLGPRNGEIDAWCEACQHPAVVPADAPAPRCARCGEPLTVESPRFEEIYGEIQNLVAVLEAWLGVPRRLRPLVPERPRFLTDLDPPASAPADPAAARDAFERLAAGAFREAREKLERLPLDEGRVAFALGVARQRLGDLPGAERAFDRAVELDPGHRPAHLDRGALRARRGDFGGARDDFANAGDAWEARWNRSALILLEAVSTAPGLPPPDRITAARAEAGEPSSFWSDHTVGRLLFSLVVERAQSRLDGAAECADARVARAAELEVEFDTFCDRAMVLLGYTALGMAVEAAATAQPLALAVLAKLRSEPFVRGEAGRSLDEALQRAVREVAAGEAGRALDQVFPFVERSDLRHYRIPCLRCGRGTLGLERVEDDPAPEAARVSRS